MVMVMVMVVVMVVLSSETKEKIVDRGEGLRRECVVGGGSGFYFVWLEIIVSLTEF